MAMHPGLVTAALGQEVPFLKGHGTGNDFVILPDINSVLDLSESQVARLCDRRFGIGGDGILHVVPSDSTQADWFMDYRNADGSIAQMCGNGARVFARYLIDAGLESAGEFQIETRAGFHQVSASGDTIAVSMGTASPGPAGGTPEARFYRIEGVADREPMIENDPSDPRNRRVSITLLWRAGSFKQ